MAAPSDISKGKGKGESHNRSKWQSLQHVKRVMCVRVGVEPVRVRSTTSKMRGSIHASAQKMLDRLEAELEREKDVEHTALQSFNCVKSMMTCAHQERHGTAEREWQVEKAAMRVDHERKV